MREFCLKTSYHGRHVSILEEQDIRRKTCLPTAAPRCHKSSGSRETALVTTKGFRIREIGWQRRPSLYDRTSRNPVHVGLSQRYEINELDPP